MRPENRRSSSEAPASERSAMGQGLLIGTEAGGDAAPMAVSIPRGVWIALLLVAGMVFVIALVAGTTAYVTIETRRTMLELESTVDELKAREAWTEDDRKKLQEAQHFSNASRGRILALFEKEFGAGVSSDHVRERLKAEEED